MCSVQRFGNDGNTESEILILQSEKSVDNVENKPKQKPKETEMYKYCLEIQTHISKNQPEG